jgi:hypothetical protein
MRKSRETVPINIVLKKYRIVQYYEITPTDNQTDCFLETAYREIVHIIFFYINHSETITLFLYVVVSLNDENTS